MIHVLEDYFVRKPDCGSGWDLMKEVERTRKVTGEKYQDFKSVGYNMTLPHVVNRVAELTVNTEGIVEIKDLIGKLGKSISQIEFNLILKEEK